MTTRLKADRFPAHWQSTQNCEQLKMTGLIPDQAIVQTASDTNRMTVEAWIAQSNATKIELIARRQVTFFKNGELIPIREALLEIKKFVAAA